MRQVENSDTVLVMIGAIILLAILGAGFAVFFKKGISKLKEKIDHKQAYEAQLWRLTDTDDDDH
jgi:hypothetical protein